MSAAEDFGDFDGMVTLGEIEDEIEDQRKEGVTPMTAAMPGLDYEACVIGAVLLSEGERMHEAIDAGLTDMDFQSVDRRLLWRAMRKLHDAGQPVTTMTVLDEVTASRTLDAVGGPAIISRYEAVIPSTAIIAPYSARIVEAATRRKIRMALESGQSLLDSHRPIFETVATIESEIARASSRGTGQDAVHIEKILTEVSDELSARSDTAGEETLGIIGIRSPWTKVDELTLGFTPALFVLAARPSIGKAQPIDANVLTRDGFVRMGDLRLGDELASLDGDPSCVVGIFPQGERQVYRVTFSDGRSTECCDEHLWRVMYRDWDEPRVLPTSRLREMLACKRYRNRVWIEEFSGEYGSTKKPPIDPWLLGYLIGNGGFTGSSVNVSTANDDVVERIARTLRPMHMQMNRGGKYDWRLVRMPKGERPDLMDRNPIKAVLERYGLFGHLAKDKFIPEDFFGLDVGARRELLAGLLDSDGWVEKFGTIMFSSASKHLAEGVVRLMRSIGGRGRITTKEPYYTYKGERLRGLTAYICHLAHPSPLSLGLTRVKAARLADGKRGRRLNVASIEAARVCETQCIAVSHPSHLYVTDDFIVTHNTAWAGQVAVHAAVEERVPTIFFSGEQKAKRIVQRMISCRSGVPLKTILAGKLTPSQWQDFVKAQGEIGDAPLWIDDTPCIDVQELRQKAKKAKREHGIGLIIGDYLQLFNVTRPGGGHFDNETQELAEATKTCKQVQRETDACFILLSQLNRGLEARSDKRPMMSDLRGSGSIEQDADVIAFLYREEYYLKNKCPPETRGVAEVIIGKARDGATGTVMLKFVGEQVRFENLHDDDHNF